MNRDEQEMALWRQVYERWHSGSGYAAAECGNIADFAVAEFRKRYPAEPTAPTAVWYDEPPFAKDGKSYPCWVDGDAVHADVYWDGSQWWAWIVGSAFQHPLAGRRVCPIVKPPEPTQ